MDTEDLGWRGPAAVLLVVVAVLVGALMFMGGQTSTILSNVGAPINNVGSNTGDPVGVGEDALADEGKQVADAAGAAAPPELLIIRTGQLEIEVADLAAAVATARTRVLAVGGYVSASDETATDWPGKRIGRLPGPGRPLGRGARRDPRPRIAGSRPAGRD